MEMCSIKSRIKNFLPPKILHHFNAFKGGENLYYRNKEAQDEVMTNLEMYEITIVTGEKQLFVNIPLVVLDYKQLIADNQPSKARSETENLTEFNYDHLAVTLNEYLDHEL